MHTRHTPGGVIVGLDIGSSAIRIAAGVWRGAARGQAPHLQIIGAVEAPSAGVHKGAVTSIEEAVSSLSQGLEELERVTGMPVDAAWVGINTTQIVAQSSKGVVAVAKTNGEISEEDVGRVVEAARMVAPPLNYEVLHVIPRRFSVDGQTGIKDPVGMSGIRLEVDTQMIYGLTTHTKNITKTVYRTGIDIHDIVWSIFAAGEVTTTARQRELGVVVVNIGAATTTLVVYEEGDIVHTAVFPFGSEHITNDLAIGLRTSIDVAERIKLLFGQCVKEGITKKDTIDLTDAGAAGEVILATYMADIIGARVSEILDRVDKELRSISRSGRLPAGVVFTGGGAKIRGLVGLAKEQVRLPASLGSAVDIIGTAERAADLSFSTAVGLVAWGAHIRDSGKGRSRAFSIHPRRIWDGVQRLFRSLMP